MASTLAFRPGWYRLAALLCSVLLASGTAQEKKLTIYAPQTGYSVPVAERDGKDYVPIIEALQPLGAVTVSIDGKKLKLGFTAIGAKKPIEAQFTDGKTEAKVRGKNVELASRFVLEGVRGLVPVHSLPALLSRCFDTPIEFHEPGRRLFVGTAGVRYAAEMRKTPARLVLSFSAPVNPTIATEPGGMRLVFAREALVAGAAGSQTLDDRTITGLSFNESNGAAELAIAASAPLVASASDGGRTITITAAPSLLMPLRTEATPALPVLPPPPLAVPQGPRFLVVIDPGHGGVDTGAALGEMAEKDFNLSLARRLRAELEGRGIHAILLRDGDLALTLEQRALLANGAHAAVYLGIHAAAAGTGVRVYTSDLAPAGSKPAFLPIDRAQAAYLDRSGVLAAGIISELGKRQLAAVSLAAPVRPLNNVATAAVALEVAPPATDAQGFASPVYQQSICSAIGGALGAVRARLEAR